MANKIKKLILCYIPTNVCNLKCEYCLVSQVDGWHDDNGIEFRYSVEHIVKGLSKKRLDGECFVNLTAQGETLLYKDIVPLTRGLLEEGHSVEIITNATVSKRIDEILELPDNLLSNLFFKCSYHYEQMKDKEIEKKYWSNVKKISASPCSFTIELMPYDKISNDISDICARCNENAGAVCHATVGRNDGKSGKDILTSLSKEDYERKWGVLNSTMFKLKMELFGKKRKEFCYAGLWSLLIDLSTGEASQCYGRTNTQNIFKDLSKPIKFRPVGYSCLQPFCFNGHAHIAWGIIPEYKSPSYFEIRNRECNDVSNWVKGGCENLFKQKLKDNNSEYSELEKIKNTITNPFYLFFSLFHDIPSVKRKAKKFFKLVTGKF